MYQINVAWLTKSSTDLKKNYKLLQSIYKQYSINFHNKNKHLQLHVILKQNISLFDIMTQTSKLETWGS